MRLLERLELHRHVGIVVELAVKRERAAGQRLAHDLQRFEIHLLPMVGIDPEISGLDRRDAAADAELEAPPAQRVEHADLLDQAQRVMERKRVDQRTEAQALRALGDRGEENAGRGGKAERRRVMLGGMIGVEAAAIVGLDDLQPLLIEHVERKVVAVEVVEDAEFHSSSVADFSCIGRGHHRTKPIPRGKRGRA
jgi:hypothetical protein